MSNRAKSVAPWNESIGMLRGLRPVTRRESLTTSLTLNEFLESKFKKTNYKVGSVVAHQVGTKYGIDPGVFSTVRKTPSQYIIATTGQILRGEAPLDIFGWSTSLSDDGNTIAVGSILNDGVNGLNSGSCRVFTRTTAEEAWIQKGVDIDGEAAQDYSGWDVSLSADGDRLVVGAVFNDDGVNENTGHVRIYDWNAGTSQWSQVGTDINGSTAGDFFGYSVALSTDKSRIAIGAPYGFGKRGYVSVYRETSGSWTKIADVEGSADEGQFGKRLALNDDGTRMVVAAPHALRDTGVVYLYEVTGAAVNSLATKIGPGFKTKFGYSLDYKANTLAATEFRTTNPIQLFDLSSDSFESEGDALSRRINQISSDVNFNVKLSRDTNHVIISIPTQDTTENVIDSTVTPQVKNLGKRAIVRVYKRSADDWVQLAWDLTSYAGNFDEYGKSISISSDGSIIAVSAPRKDDGGVDRGCVNAYTVRPISFYVKPTITLNGLNPQPMQANTQYVESGAVTDTGAVVTIVGDIEDNTVEGNEFVIRYTASSNFESTTVERTVVITKDPTVPVLSFIGEEVVKIPVNGVFNDPGVLSNVPGTITIDDSEVDYQKIGEYRIAYQATSTYGIKSEILYRTVYIVYETEFDGQELSGKRVCMSRDGYICAVGDFSEDTVKTYEWDAITSEWKQLGADITGPTGSSFGADLAVSTDGLTIAIGAPTFNSPSVTLTGLVRVYSYSFLNNAWEVRGDDIVDGAYGDSMGQLVAISGDGNVVSTGTATPIGAKNPYVFTYTFNAATDTFSQIHTYTEDVKLPGNVISKQFSISLNNEGSRLLLGVPVNNFTTGAVFLFDTATGQTITSVFGGNVGDALGQSVQFSIGGDRFVIGDVANEVVKVYSQSSSGSWSQLGNAITDGVAGNSLGSFVSLSTNGNIVSFSAPSDEQGQGLIYQFAWNGTHWLPNVNEISNNISGTLFGRRFFVTEDASRFMTESTFAFQAFRWNSPRAIFSLNGSRIIRRNVDEVYNYDYVTTPFNVVTEGVVNSAVSSDYLIKYIVTNNGQSDVVYQLVSVSGELLQLAPDVLAFDESATPLNLGWSTSISDDGEQIAVGAPGFNNNTGLVKIYRFTPATITWDLDVTLNGPTAGSSFGYDVCFSGDGQTIAIGAPDATNGVVSVFRYTSGAWTQLGPDLVGSADGKFGFSLGMNLDGSRVVVGEPRKAFDINTGAGGVTTYEYNGTNWSIVSELSYTNNQLEHELGYDVAMTSSNVVLIGAPTAGPGYVKLSSYLSGNVPIFAQPLVFGEKFGWAVSIDNSANSFAVSAPYYDNKRGRVLVFDATTTPPSLKGNVIVGESPDDQFGLSLHMFGNGQKLMVRAKNGRVSNYTYNSGQWSVVDNEVLTTTATDTNFGYALTGSSDGRRMVVSSPLYDQGAGLVQVFSNETTKISNSDFVAPILTLLGPTPYRVESNAAYVDQGVRRDDGETEFTTSGTVDTTVPGNYTVEYGAQDTAGNTSEAISRTVTVVDTTMNNIVTTLDGPNNNHNNSSVQLSSDGTRVAIVTGVSPETETDQYRDIFERQGHTPGDGVSGTSIGVQGNCKVYDLDASVYPPTFTQFGQTITSSERYFATSVKMSQDGSKVAVMSSPDDCSTKVSVFGLQNQTYNSLPAPFPRSETSSAVDNTFGLPSQNQVQPITSNSTFITSLDPRSRVFGNLFGRDGEKSYRYQNMATSSDGRVVAVGKPTSNGGSVSVYQLSDALVTIETFSQQGGAIAENGPFGELDVSDDGSKIVFSSGTDTFVYNTSGNVKETQFSGTETFNAISHDGSVVAFPTAKNINFKPIILTGGDRITIAYGETWVDPGFQCDDPVTVTGSVDSDVQGDHVVTYSTATNTQIRIVRVSAPSTEIVNLDGSSGQFSNVPYGPGFLGFKGQWRTQDFALFTVPIQHGTLSPDNGFQLSITLNGRIPNAHGGGYQYMTLEVYTDNGFSSSIDFTSNGTGPGEAFSWNGSTFTDRVRTTDSVSGTLSGGDLVRGRVHLYNTYFTQFSMSAQLRFGPVSQITNRTPTITLTGFATNTIDTGEDFVDPGFTSDNPTDILTTEVNHTFPIAVSCRKAILYKATSAVGVHAYAVRYVSVEKRPQMNVFRFQQNAWTQFANAITIDESYDLHTTGDVCVSQFGSIVAFSKYSGSAGSIFVFQYSQQIFPPAWVQLGSRIDLTGGSPGFSMAMSGDGKRLVIGNPSNQSGGVGDVLIYDYNDTSWVSRGQDLRSLTEGYFSGAGVTDHSMEYYGRTVDISRDGTQLIIGSPRFDGLTRGHLSVFELSMVDIGGVLVENFVLKGDPLISGGTFANRVALSNDGNTLITTDEDPNNATLERVVYYQYDGTTWSDHGYNHPQSFSISSDAGTALVKLTADGAQLYTLTGDFRIYTPTTVEVEAEWEQRGADITINSLTQPPVDTHPTPSAGNRYSPGQFVTTNNVIGYAVDLSQDGNTLAIGMPFLHFSPSIIRGAAAVFTYNSGTDAWSQVGGLIVPKYEYKTGLKDVFGTLTSPGSDYSLNQDAEKVQFHGACISLSGDGSYLCVGSPGYLQNPVDLPEKMDSLPNQGGLTSFTLFKRNTAYSPTNDHFSVGWQPIVTKYSNISESLQKYKNKSDVDENKRELLGLALQVSSDGSFVAYDTRTDGVKVLAKGSSKTVGNILSGVNEFQRYIVNDSVLGTLIPDKTKYQDGVTIGNDDPDDGTWDEFVRSGLVSQPHLNIARGSSTHTQYPREPGFHFYLAPVSSETFKDANGTLQATGNYTDINGTPFPLAGTSLSSYVSSNSLVDAVQRGRNFVPLLHDQSPLLGPPRYDGTQNTITSPLSLDLSDGNLPLGHEYFHALTGDDRTYTSQSHTTTWNSPEGLGNTWGTGTQYNFRGSTNYGFGEILSTSADCKYMVTRRHLWGEFAAAGLSSWKGQDIGTSGVSSQSHLDAYTGLSDPSHHMNLLTDYHSFSEVYVYYRDSPEDDWVLKGEATPTMGGGSDKTTTSALRYSEALELHSGKNIVSLSGTGRYLNKLEKINGSYWMNDFGTSWFGTSFPIGTLKESLEDSNMDKIVLMEYTMESGIAIPVTFGRSWQVNFTLETRVVSSFLNENKPVFTFIFYAPQEPRHRLGSQHGGFSVVFNLNPYQTINLTIHAPGLKDSSEADYSSLLSEQFASTDFQLFGAHQDFSTLLNTGSQDVQISYDNGLITVNVVGTPQSPHTYQFVHEELEKQKEFWDVESFVGFSGFVTLGPYDESSLYLKDLELTWGTGPLTTTRAAALGPSDPALYLIPRNAIYKTLLESETSSYTRNMRSINGRHCGLALCMENFGTESHISDDGMTLLISNFIGVPGDYQFNKRGNRDKRTQERWESFSPMDEMNDFGNCVYIFKYDQSKNKWVPKSHKPLLIHGVEIEVEEMIANQRIGRDEGGYYTFKYGRKEKCGYDPYAPPRVETQFHNDLPTSGPGPSTPGSLYTGMNGFGNYITEFQVDVPRSSPPVDADFNALREYLEVNNPCHRIAPYPIFPSYFDFRFHAKDSEVAKHGDGVLGVQTPFGDNTANGDGYEWDTVSNVRAPVQPGHHQCRRRDNLDYTSQFARSCSLSGDGNVVAICEPNWNPLYDGNDIGKADGTFESGTIPDYPGPAGPHSHGTWNKDLVYQRIHRDFCRSTVTTGSVQYDEHDTTQIPGGGPLPPHKGGDTKYWVPYRPSSDITSGAQRTHFESPGLVARGYRNAVRPGDPGRVLFLRYNSAEDKYDIDKSLPPFYSIQLLNHVEDSVRQMRHNINTSSNLLDSQGGFQYTIFKCELNYTGDEVTFFACYPSDFMQRHGISSVTNRAGIYTFKLKATIPEETVRAETGDTPSAWGSNFYTSWYPPQWFENPLTVNAPNHLGHPHEGWVLTYTNQWELKSKILTDDFGAIHDIPNTQLYFKGDTSLVHSGPNHDPNKFNVVHDLGIGLQVAYPGWDYPMQIVEPMTHLAWYIRGETRDDDKDAKVITQRRYLNNWRSTHPGHSWENLLTTPQFPLGLKSYEDGSILFYGGMVTSETRVWLFQNSTNVIPDDFFGTSYPQTNDPNRVDFTVVSAVYAPSTKRLVVTNYTKPQPAAGTPTTFPDPQLIISLCQFETDTNDASMMYGKLRKIYSFDNYDNFVSTYDTSYSYGRTNSDLVLTSGLKTDYVIDASGVVGLPQTAVVGLAGVAAGFETFQPFTMPGLSLAVNEDASVILFSSGANFKKNVFRGNGSTPEEIRTGNGAVHGAINSSPPFISGLQEFAQVHTITYSTIEQTTDDWAVQTVIPNDTTPFLESYGFLGDGASSLITYDATIHKSGVSNGDRSIGYGNYPSKLWPTSYLTLSPNNQYLSIGKPIYDPSNATTTNLGFREGSVSVLKAENIEKPRKSVKNLTLLDILNKIDIASPTQNLGNKHILNLYEPLTIAMSRDGKTIAIASPLGKVSNPQTQTFPFYEGEKYFTLASEVNTEDEWVNAPSPTDYYHLRDTYTSDKNLRSWVQLYSLVDGRWVEKGKLIKPVDTGAPGRPIIYNPHSSIDLPNSDEHTNGMMHYPGQMDYTPKNFRISLGQFMDLSEDGSRLVVSAMKASLNSNTSGIRNPSQKPEQIHEVYIYDYNAVADEWTANRTPDGRFKAFDGGDYTTFPERIFVNNVYNHSLDTTTGIYSNELQWDDVYLDATQTEDKDNGSERERRTVGSVSGVAISPNGQRISVSFSNYSSSNLGSYPTDTYPGAPSIPDTSRCVEMVLVFEYHKNWFKYPTEEENAIVHEIGGLVRNSEPAAQPHFDDNVGLNVFPRNVNASGQTFGVNIFQAQKQLFTGWSNYTPKTKDYENVYITGGEYANWKLLHWEFFTGELRLAEVNNQYEHAAQPGSYTRALDIPHSIVSGLKFCGNDAVLIERYDNSAGTDKGVYEKQYDGPSRVNPRVKFTQYNPPVTEIVSEHNLEPISRPAKKKLCSYGFVDFGSFYHDEHLKAHNAYKFPCLLVLDELAPYQDASGTPYSTSIPGYTGADINYIPNAGIKRQVVQTDGGYAVEWAEGAMNLRPTNTTGTPAFDEYPLENEDGGKDGTHWINPITGWIRVDFCRKLPVEFQRDYYGNIVSGLQGQYAAMGAERFDETPFSVDVASTYVNAEGHIQPTRVVFGIPQAANHRGKIAVFDITTAKRPIEMVNAANFRNYDVILEQVGSDIFGDEVKGRFGESVSISEDGLRIAVGNRPFYLDPSRGADYDTPVPTKVYLCEWDAARLQFITSVTTQFPVVGPLEDPLLNEPSLASSVPTLTEYQNFFANTVDSCAYTKFGRPPCLELPDIDVGMQSDGTILFEKPHVVWIDSRYRAAKVKLSGDGTRVLVSVFNGFYVLDLGDPSQLMFSQIGTAIKEATPSSVGMGGFRYVWDQNEFPYSNATFSQDGKTVVVPWGNIPDEFASFDGDFEKKFSIFALNDSNTVWVETETQTVEGASVGWARDGSYTTNNSAPVEHTYLAVLSGDKNRVTSIYMGTPSTTATPGLSGVPLDPVLRQYLISGTQQIPSWSQIGVDIILQGKDLNRQSISSAILCESQHITEYNVFKKTRFRRPCAFTMSDAGDKIAIGQDNDYVFYSQARKVESASFTGSYGDTISTGSVTIFSYDAVNTTWKTQKVAVPDDENLLNFQGGGIRRQYAPGSAVNPETWFDLRRRARFGHALEFSGDGNTLVVSAPELRNGLGTIFFFDTSAEVVTEKLTTNTRFHNTETIYDGEIHDNLGNPGGLGSFGYSLAVNNDATRMVVSVPDYAKFYDHWLRPSTWPLGANSGRVIVADYDSTLTPVRRVTNPYLRTLGGSETLVPYAIEQVQGLSVGFSGASSRFNYDGGEVLALLTGKKAVFISDDGNTIGYTVTGDQFTAVGTRLDDGGFPYPMANQVRPWLYTTDPDRGLYQRVVVATKDQDGNFVARANNIFSKRLKDHYSLSPASNREVRDQKKEYMYVSDDGKRVIYSAQSRAHDLLITNASFDSSPHIFAFYYDDVTGQYEEQGLGDVLAGPGYNYTVSRPQYPRANTQLSAGHFSRESTAGFFTTRYPANYGGTYPFPYKIRAARSYEFSMDKTGNKVVVLSPFERGGTTNAITFDYPLVTTGPAPVTQWLWSAGVHTFIWKSETTERYEQGTGTTTSLGSNPVTLQKGFDPEPPSPTNDNSQIVLSTSSQAGTRAEDHKLAMSRDGTKLILICHVVDGGGTSTGTKVSVYEWDESNLQWTFLNTTNLTYSALSVSFSPSDLDMNSQALSDYSSPQDVLPNPAVSEDGSRLVLEYRQGPVLKRKEVVFDIQSSGLLQFVSSFSVTTQNGAGGGDATVQYGSASDPQITPRLSRDGSRLFQQSYQNGVFGIGVFDCTTGTSLELVETDQDRIKGQSSFHYDTVFNISQSDETTNIIVSSPYEDTGNSQVKGVFDIYEIFDATLPVGFDNQNVTIIDSPTDSEVIGGYQLQANIRFGESIDVAGDNIIISRGGIHNTGTGIMVDKDGSARRDGLLTFINNGGLEVAEIWSKTGSTWSKDSTYQRLKTTTNNLTDTNHLYELTSWSSVFPWMANAKISDGGDFSIFGLRSIKEWASDATTTTRQRNQISLLKRTHDLTPPIALVGPSVVEVAAGTTYVDQGATADAGLTVVTSGEVNTDILGTYVVRYTVTRTGLSNFVERTVKVVLPTAPPTVTLIGDASVTLEQPVSYTEPDPPATFTGGVLERYGVPPDGSVSGVFTIRYVVRNGLGVAQAERTVTINPDTTPPILTIFGGDIVHKVNTNYRDPSFIGSDGNENVLTTTPPYLLTVKDIGNFRGTTQITYSATDQVGNTGTQLRSVTVKDDFEASTVTTPESVVAIAGTGNRVASVVGQDLSLHETGGALVNTWTGVGAQTVKLNSDGTVIAFTTSSRVFVYEYTSSWVERQPEAAYSGFGVPGATAFSIELSDDASTLAVSYPGGTTAFIEEVAVFRWNGTAYTLDYNQGSAESIGLGTSMSLKSDGTRLALGYPNKNFSTGADIASTVYSFTTPSPILNGVRKVGIFAKYYKLTSYGVYGANNTMYWSFNLGSSWKLSWEWYIYGPRWGGADDMRFIYFATNPITAYQASVHNGYNNFYEFWLGDTHQIRDNRDVYQKTANVYYGTRRFLKVEVEYDNGVMTSTVRDLYSQELISTISHDFGTAHQHLWNTQTYFGFSGRTGGVSSSQWIRNINLSSVVENVGEVEVFDRAGPSSWSRAGDVITGGIENQKLGSVVKLSGDGSTLVNVNNGRDGNGQKVEVFAKTGANWVKNQTLLDNVITRTTDANDGDDRVDISDDGSLLVYAKGVGTETYTTHPNGLTSKTLDGFKLDGGVYKHAMVIPSLPSASTQRVVLARNKSKVLINSSVFDIAESIFTPIITLNQSDDVDPLVVSSYSEQGGVSSDGATVQIHSSSETVLSTAGIYRVRYFTSTGGFRVRTVQILG